MRKISKSVIAIAVVLLFSIFYCAKVYAAEASISFNGDKEVEVGKEQTVYINVSNETEIGVIQGKISGDDNTQIVNIEAKDDNWTVNYNSITKEFNVYYSDGIKNGDVLAVKYKLKTGATNGKITLSDIELTTITYKTINKTSIEFPVTAKAGTSSDDNGNGSSNRNSDESGNSNTGTTSETGSGSGTQTKTSKSKNGIIPQLGQNGIIIIAIAGSIVLAIISYIRLKKRK